MGSNSTGSKGSAIMALVFIAVGVGLLVYGGLTVRKTLACAGWPTVGGTVTASGIKTTARRDRETRRTTYSHAPEVSYRYVVEGRTLVGNRITFFDFATSSKRRAEKIAARYAMGTDVEVHYNPDDPASAVLETSLRLSSFVPAGAGAVFLAAGVFILIASMRPPSKSKQHAVPPDS